MSLVLRVCSSRHPAAEVLPADEARAAGRHRHAGGLPVERRREFQKAHLRFCSLWTAFSRSGPSLKRSLFNCWCGCLSQICRHTLHDKRFLKDDFKVKVSDDDDDACLSSGVVLQCVGGGRSSQSGGSGQDSSNDGLPLFTRGQHRYVRHLSIVLKRNDWLSN